MEVDPDQLDIERQWRLVQQWLLSADARAAAASELRGSAIVGLEADDLLAETAVRLWRTLRDRDEPVDEGDDGHGLVRYARRALRNAAIDALRAAARRPEVPVPEPIEVDPDDSGPGVRGWLHAVRRALHAEMDESPRRAAAALAAAAVLADGLDLPADVTQPVRDVTPSQAAVWAGLWYVEGDGLFGDGGDAGRQRRRRVSNQVSDVLHRCVAAADPGGGDA